MLPGIEHAGYVGPREVLEDTEKSITVPGCDQAIN
jgi:hypothetical protein